MSIALFLWESCAHVSAGLSYWASLIHSHFYFPSQSCYYQLLFHSCDKNNSDKAGQANYKDNTYETMGCDRKT